MRGLNIRSWDNFILFFFFWCWCSRLGLVNLAIRLCELGFDTLELSPHELSVDVFE